MVKFGLWRSTALAGAAVAGALFAAPALAQDARGFEALAGVELAQAEGRGRWFGREARSDDGASRPVRGEWQARAQARQEQRQARQEQRAEPPQRNAAEGGWRWQRPAADIRHRRNWDDSGSASRPLPARRGAEPTLPESGASEQRIVVREPRHRVVRWPRPGAEARIPESDASEQHNVVREPRHRVVRWPRPGAEAPVPTVRNRIERDGDGRGGNDRDGWRDNGSRYAGDYNRNRWRDGDRRWNDGWRRDRRYDWYTYRNYNRGAYRLGRYYAPYRNYYYRPLGIGFFLEPLFFGQRYWIADPWQYRLPPAYGPYRWVRYYDDILLVDVYSGEVVDVIRNFFW